MTIESNVKQASDIPKPIWLQEFCEAHGVSPKTVRRLIKDQRIACVRVYGKIGFLPEHISEFLNRNSVQAAEKPTSSSSVDEVVRELKEKAFRRNKAEPAEK